MQEETSFFTSEVQVELREFVSQLEEDLSKQVQITEMGPVAAREERENGTPTRPKPVLSDKAITREIPTDNRSVPVRAFIPTTQIDGVYLHIHGGGFVTGRAHHQDDQLLEIMEDANAVVISVDYRLAPEDPYPAAQDDCEVVAEWVIENAQTEFGTDRIAIGGESAGGHLAASTMIRMRDRHGYSGFSGANINYTSIFSGASDYPRRGCG